jgi:hypothetical protein
MSRLTEASVSESLDEFVCLWNQGKLEQACDCYTPDASFVGKGGYLLGKQRILEYYLTKYPNPSSMGRLSLQMLEFRCAEPPHDATTASAILRWTVETEGGRSTGYAMETYVLTEGKVYIVQDATISEKT